MPQHLIKRVLSGAVRPPDMTKSPKRRTRKPQGEIRPLSATPRLSKHDRILYIPLHFRDYGSHVHLNTGAIQSAASENELRRKLSANRQLSNKRDPRLTTKFISPAASS